MEAKQDIAFWNLERQGMGLAWDGCSLVEVAGRYGTPLYVVSFNLLKRCHGAIRGAFLTEGLEPRLFFSYKTNPVPAVVRRVADLGCGAEIISEFEFWLARNLGIRGSDIVVNGSAKTPELLRLAVLGDVALINVESPGELRALEETATRLEKPVRVGLRINPCLSGRPFDFTIASGTRSSHAGFRYGEPEWAAALKTLRNHPFLRLRGLHFHIGSGIRRVRPYRDALKRALTMWSDLLAAGFQPEVLDLGGGFGSPAVKEFSLFEAARYIGFGRPPATAHPGHDDRLFADLARMCSTTLLEYSQRRRIDLPAIYLEPGRALVASSQMLLLKITALRKRPGHPVAAICDAGALSLSPLLLSEHHFVLPVNKPLDGPAAKYDLLGNLPAPLDFVALRRHLPLLEPGDLVAVMDVGAYFTALANNFGGPRPAIVVIENGTSRLARERESFEGMISRDIPKLPAANCTADKIV